MKQNETLENFKNRQIIMVNINVSVSGSYKATLHSAVMKMKEAADTEAAYKIQGQTCFL